MILNSSSTSLGLWENLDMPSGGHVPCLNNNLAGNNIFCQGRVIKYRVDNELETSRNEKSIKEKYTLKILFPAIWQIVVVLLLSCVRLFATPWTVDCQASLSMGFPRQEYWNGLPFPSPGDLPNPGIEPASLVSGIGRQILEWLSLQVREMLRGQK